MIKFSISLVCLLISFGLGAQVTFILESIPDYTPPEDNIYIAGDFNGWNPGDPAFMLDQNSMDQWEITLEGFTNGTSIQYKFTRGDWGTVEKGPNGEEIANRQFTFGNGDTVYISIHNWAGGGGPSTAAENVFIMDEAFEMPQLNRTRRIWIYLPPDYDESSKDYPVLYMHDGQNLFDQLTSFLGEWEVDETLNELAGQGYQVPIVVGIDNGGAYRTDEYTPWVNTEYGGGQGDEYMAFIVETLKPYIDENYRTLPGREHTGLMGSSLGGLISTYGAMKYQDIFSKSGPFSPAYWINNDSIWDYISATGKQYEIRFYQNMGSLEHPVAISQMEQMEDSLNSIGFENVLSKVIEGGEHNEQTWRDDFAEAYLWLFASYANDIPEYENVKPLYVFPNPANETLTIRNIELDNTDIITVIDSSGRLVKEIKSEAGETSLDIRDLEQGSYIIRIIKPGYIYSGRFVKF
jgi:alpha-glucosidase